MKFKAFLFLLLVFAFILVVTSADTSLDDKKANEVKDTKQHIHEAQPVETTPADIDEKDEAKANYGGGGRCRYGCCTLGLYGQCRRCCMNAYEARAAQNALNNELADMQNEDEANKYGGGGGRCRYGCCGYGAYGRCRRCCMNANEAQEAQIAEKNERASAQKLFADKKDFYGGGWGGWGGGWIGDHGWGYGWGGGPGGGGYGWGGRGGGGGYGWGGGGHGGGYGGGGHGGGWGGGGHNAQEDQEAKSKGKP